ncbi:hypothetical protein HID58_084418, partial [Brassica napus]
GGPGGDDRLGSSLINSICSLWHKLFMLSIPVFLKVDQLKLGTSGHTLTVKVVGQTSVPQKPNAASSHLRPNRIAKCLVGDETASILFTARNDQVDLMKPGTTVKIDMFKGSMRLVVDKMGSC